VIYDVNICVYVLAYYWRELDLAQGFIYLTEPFIIACTKAVTSLRGQTKHLSTQSLAGAVQYFVR
jgi:hypothetical protein